MISLTMKQTLRMAFVVLLISSVSKLMPQAHAQKKQLSRFEQDLKRSTETIQAQRIERAKQTLEQASKRAQEISDEASGRCKTLKEEETAMIGNGRGPAFPFRAFRQATPEEIEEAKRPYEEQIKSVEADTARRIQDILDEGQRAVDAIEQSAAHVHKGVHEFAPDAPRKQK